MKLTPANLQIGTSADIFTPKTEKDAQTLKLSDAVCLNNSNTSKYAATSENEAIEVNLEEDNEPVKTEKTSKKAQKGSDEEDVRDPKTAKYYYDEESRTGTRGKGFQIIHITRTYVWEDGYKDTYSVEPDGSLLRLADLPKLTDIDTEELIKNNIQVRTKNPPKEDAEKTKETQDPKTAYGFYESSWHNPATGEFGTTRTYMWQDGHKEDYEKQPDGSYKKIEGIKLDSNIELEYVGKQAKEK